jgi:hypothetical protein
MDAEKPVYILKQKMARSIVPKTISLLTLAIIFYLGLLINISLLELTGKEETLLKTGGLIVLTVVVILGIMLGWRKAARMYKFYAHKITAGKEFIMYKDIINTKMKRNVLDKMFKTYHIELGNKFILKNVGAEVDVQDYLKQLVKYASSLN